MNVFSLSSETSISFPESLSSVFFHYVVDLCRRVLDTARPRPCLPSSYRRTWSEARLCVFTGVSFTMKLGKLVVVSLGISTFRYFRWDGNGEGSLLGCSVGSFDMNEYISLFFLYTRLRYVSILVFIFCSYCFYLGTASPGTTTIVRGRKNKVQKKNNYDCKVTDVDL